jgi:hypothetical protein
MFLVSTLRTVEDVFGVGLEIHVYKLRKRLHPLTLGARMVISTRHQLLMHETLNTNKNAIRPPIQVTIEDISRQTISRTPFSFFESRKAMDVINPPTYNYFYSPHKNFHTRYLSVIMSVECGNPSKSRACFSSLQSFSHTTAPTRSYRNADTRSVHSLIRMTMTSLPCE